MKIEDRVIFRTVLGSKAFGLDDHESDVDEVNIWVGPPLLNGPSVVVRNSPGVDRKFLEIRHVGEKVLSGDINAIELINSVDFIVTGGPFHLFQPGVAPLLVADSWRKRALSFSFKVLMDNKATPKELVHVYRVLITALHFIRTGRFVNSLRVLAPLEVATLIGIKRGHLDAGALRNSIAAKRAELESLSPLPTEGCSARMQDCVAEVLIKCWRDESFVSPAIYA